MDVPDWVFRLALYALDAAAFWAKLYVSYLLLRRWVLIDLRRLRKLRSGYTLETNAKQDD